MRIKSILIIAVMLLCSMKCYCEHNHSHHEQNAHSTEKDKDRWLWQLPRKVMKEIGIKEGMVVADVGAGDGYFTIPLAQKVGNKGIIIASDIDQNGLDKIKVKSDKLGLKNIRIILGDENNPKLPSGQIDIVLIVNTIHYIKDLNSVLDNIKTSLKPGGKMVIIQWDAEKMNIEAEREWDAEDKRQFSMRTTLKRIYAANFEVEKILTFLPMQNIFICVPDAGS
ncbi:class I SAM-dependent methyltransferase [candidate division CSSED10-310 bacterium]|uniref:Class I SAM-dependent methyltransferase n=1 Tax=candidate division CSSED10-310 bacterium TaxID=2855610 RepID=A0ABV6Z5G9_UNCC1